MQELLNDIRSCTICESHLPLGSNPIVSVSEQSKVLIIGQAPGTIVHKTGVPWNDQSGKTLRTWLDVDETQFYDNKNFGIMPMGFCYPGKGRSGDLPPRPECAKTWHKPLLNHMKDASLILLIGQYAQRYYLGKSMKKNLTETVKSWVEYLPKYLPLPHPSPRNRIWLKRNPWFEVEVIPTLREQVKQALISNQ